MKTLVSSNTKAILMLTAPLIIGHERTVTQLLTHSEYNRLARVLAANHYEPGDLLEAESDTLFSNLQNLVEVERLKNLLSRGFLLSQAIERWRSRSIWVISRSDTGYPTRLNDRLKDAAPPIIFGCGDESILETGGLAIVGSRNVDEKLISYTENVGRLAAKAQRTVISGGARGIDRAAMFGCLQIGGYVAGVLADSLERLVLSRDTREYLMDNKLVLISPYDPSAGFDVGHAMQRNKIIYALSDSALIVNSDYEKGGTWTGAVEQLEKLHLVPLYIRDDKDSGFGLKALRKKGALPWPNPETSEDFAKVLITKINMDKQKLLQKELPLSQLEGQEKVTIAETSEKYLPVKSPEITISPSVPITTADELYKKVKEIILSMKMPTTEAEVSENLHVLKGQAKDWLQRLVSEGELKKKRKPVGYVIDPNKQGRLINNV